MPEADGVSTLPEQSGMLSFFDAEQTSVGSANLVSKQRVSVGLQEYEKSYLSKSGLSN